MDEDNRPAAEASAAPLPRILVTLPSVEDLHSILVLLRAAGAQITTRHREFEICGPLNAEQAAAVWMLAHHRDNGNRIDVQVDPGWDLRAALDAMTPGGWSEDAFDFHAAYDADPWDATDDWWHEQQRLQGELRRDPKPVPPPVPATAPPPPPEPVGGCCGEGGRWAPKAGEPHVQGCQLCPRSMTYWKRGRTPTPAP